MEFQVKISLALFTVGFLGFLLMWLMDSINAAVVTLFAYLFLWSPMWLFVIGDSCYHSQNFVARGFGIVFYLAAILSFVCLVDVVANHRSTT